MQLSDSIIRRSLRLLHAIDILHQRGYQNLGILGPTAALTDAQTLSLKALREAPLKHI